MTYAYKPKNIMITGATSGFGAAMAKLFAKELGCKLILTGRRVDRLEALKAELDVPVLVLEQDITDLDKVKSDIASLPSEFSDVDCLINNAGLGIGGEVFYDKPEDDINMMIDVNVRGLSNLTRAVLPGMVERKIGHIVNLSSIAGIYPYTGGNTYCATKAFVKHFSLALRADVKGKNVRVTSIEPGAVETEFSVVRFKGDEEKAAAVYNTHRKMVASEVADIILWVISQPAHINVNCLEFMPTDHSFAGFEMNKFEG